MARLNVDRMSLRQLLDLQAKIEKAIAAARERERAALKQEMAELAEKRGFTMADLLGRRGKTGKVAPKYRNPDDPAQTWTGRGRKPLWLVAKVKKGARLGDLLI